MQVIQPLCRVPHGGSNVLEAELLYPIWTHSKGLLKMGECFITWKEIEVNASCLQVWASICINKEHSGENLMIFRVPSNISLSMILLTWKGERIQRYAVFCLMCNCKILNFMSRSIVHSDPEKNSYIKHISGGTLTFSWYFDITEAWSSVQVLNDACCSSVDVLAIDGWCIYHCKPLPPSWPWGQEIHRVIN